MERSGLPVAATAPNTFGIPSTLELEFSGRVEDSPAFALSAIPRLEVKVVLPSSIPKARRPAVPTRRTEVGGMIRTTWEIIWKAKGKSNV